MFSGLGSSELIIIFVIVFFLFGGKKIPEIARGLGEAMREFRRGSAGEEEKKEEDEDKNE